MARARIPSLQGRALICAGPCCGRQVEASPLTSNAEGESEAKQDTGAERKGVAVVKGELSMRTEQYYRKRVKQINGAGFDSFSG